MSGNNFSYSAEVLKSNVQSQYNTYWWGNSNSYGGASNATAQHIIPSQTFSLSPSNTYGQLNRTFLDQLNVIDPNFSFNLNGADNGVLLPNSRNASEILTQNTNMHATIHSGNAQHNAYNDYMIGKFNNIRETFDSSTAHLKTGGALDLNDPNIRNHPDVVQATRVATAQVNNLKVTGRNAVIGGSADDIRMYLDRDDPRLIDRYNIENGYTTVDAHGNRVPVLDSNGNLHPNYVDPSLTPTQDQSSRMAGFQRQRWSADADLTNNKMLGFSRNTQATFGLDGRAASAQITNPRLKAALVKAFGITGGSGGVLDKSSGAMGYATVGLFVGVIIANIAEVKGKPIDQISMAEVSSFLEANGIDAKALIGMAGDFTKEIVIASVATALGGPFALGYRIYDFIESYAGLRAALDAAVETWPDNETLRYTRDYLKVVDSYLGLNNGAKLSQEFIAFGANASYEAISRSEQFLQERYRSESDSVNNYGFTSKNGNHYNLVEYKNADGSIERRVILKGGIVVTHEFFNDDGSSVYNMYSDKDGSLSFVAILDYQGQAIATISKSDELNGFEFTRYDGEETSVAIQTFMPENFLAGFDAVSSYSYDTQSDSHSFNGLISQQAFQTAQIWTNIPDGVQNTNWSNVNFSQTTLISGGAIVVGRSL